MFSVEIRKEAQILQQDRKGIQTAGGRAKNSRKHYPMDYGIEHGSWSKTR